MSIAVKICGLTRADHVGATAAAGGSMGGFNFFPPSPRYVTNHDAAKRGREDGHGAEFANRLAEGGAQFLGIPRVLKHKGALQITGAV